MGGKAVGCIPEITEASYWTDSQGPCTDRKLSNRRKEDPADTAIHKHVFRTSQWLVSHPWRGICTNPKGR